MRALKRLQFRVRQGWLWWKHSWWFQFAHGPLCERYQNNALRIGRLRACRSCLLLYLAMLSTFAVLLFVDSNPRWTLPLGYGLLGPLTVLSYPWIYKRWPRAVKDLLRFCVGASLALIVGLLFTSWWWMSAITMTILYGLFRLFRIKRRQVKATECDGCPELGGNCVCSGYARQAESIRQFRDVVDEEMNHPAIASLFVLPLLKADPKAKP